MPTLYERIDALACEQQRQALHDVLDGMTPRDAMLAQGLRSSQLYVWQVSNSDFAELYDEVSTIAKLTLSDRLVSIEPIHANPRHAAVITQNIRWYLEKRAPSTFGQQATVSHRMEGEKRDRLERARQRAMPRIEGTVDSASSSDKPNSEENQ